jgi:hypothetical protein
MADMSPQDFTPSADDLMSRMQALAPPRGAAPSDSIPTMTVRPSNSAPSVDDLMARMNTIAPPVVTAGTSKDAPPTGSPDWTTEGGAVIGHPTPGPALNIATAGVKGAIEGFGNPIGQTILSPEAQALLDAKQRQGGVGGALAGIGSTAADDIGTAGGVVLGAGNALLRGAQGVVAQTGAELGQPQLGRDIAAIPEAFAGSPNMLARGPVPTELPLAERPFIPRTAADGNLLANFPRPTDLPVNRMVAPPDTIPSMRIRAGEPAPNAAGAQASTTAEATMTPEQIAANRHSAEMEWLNKTNQPGVSDNRELIPGISPTEAQREQTVTTAREQKSISQQDTVVSDEERALADAHNQTRNDYYKQPDLAGSSVQLANGEKAASDKIEAGLAEAWANKTKANAQPVVDLADKTLGGRSGKRAAIESEVSSVRSRLFDAKGNLETDPEILYGVREHINDVLSRENQAQNPVSKRAQSVLIAMRDELDNVIEPAAPGFKAAIAGYAEDMKPLDVMRALGERESGLFDSLGKMQFSRVHSLMRDVIDARQPGAALSPFQNMTEAQMTKLQNLHDDLKRVASSEDLARAKGSDTAQNAWDAMRSAGKGIVIRGANMVPVLGPMLRRGSEAYAPIAEAKAANKLRQRGLSMLHPDPAKFPLRNMLSDPD